MNTDLLNIAIIMLFAMMSPGPDMILIIKNATLGTKQGLYTVFGISFGIGIQLILICFGLTQLIFENYYLKISFQIAGASYLIYLAFKILKDSKELDLKHDHLIKQTPAKCFKEALITNLLNIKAFLFFISLFSILANELQSDLFQIKIALFLFFECLIVWSLFAVSLRVNLIKKNLLKYKRYLDRLFSIALLFFASKLLYITLIAIRD